MTRLVRERGLGAGSRVVEIASNDGYLLQHYVAAGVPVLGIEPATNIAEVARGRGIDTISEFFGESLAAALAAEGRTADVIHANNVMAHVPDIRGFVAGLRHVLKPGGVAVVEAPYVRDLVERCEFDTIYHEHVFYFSLTALVRLCAAEGLAVTDVERLHIHGGSLRLFITHGGAPSTRVQALLDEEQALGILSPEYYATFAERVDALRDTVVTLLRHLKAGGATAGRVRRGRQGLDAAQLLRHRRDDARLRGGSEHPQAGPLHAGRRRPDRRCAGTRQASPGLHTAARLELRQRGAAAAGCLPAARRPLHRADPARPGVVSAVRPHGRQRRLACPSGAERRPPRCVRSFRL